jgi:hypothetical protein
MAADRLARRKATGIDPDLARRLGEVDPTKLLMYLGSLLPIDDLAFQAKFVIDRDSWLRGCIAILQAELSPVAR